MIHTVDSLHRTGKVRREGDCVVWCGATAGKGYPVVKDDRERYVHRLVLLLDGRPVGPGQQAAHSCGNSLCINPKHLRPTTQHENERDKIAHGRYNHGHPGITHCGKWTRGGRGRCRQPVLHDGACSDEVFQHTYEETPT